jgi:hypothetical protein
MLERSGNVNATTNDLLKLFKLVVDRRLFRGYTKNDWISRILVREKMR